MGNLLRRTRNSRESRKIPFGEQLDKAFKKAVAEEIEKHRLVGNSIPVFRSGKVILIPPEQIEPFSPERHKTDRSEILRLRRSRKKAREKAKQLMATVRKIAVRH